MVLICIIISILILLLGIILAFRVRSDLKSFSAIMTVTVSLAVAVLVFPIYNTDADVVISILQSFRYGLGTIGMSVSNGLEEYLQISGPLAVIYKVLLYLLYLAGPICASMFIISYSRFLIDALKTRGSRKVHVFSQLNSRSYALGKSISEMKGRNIILYCNVDDFDDYVSEIRSFGAMLIHGDEKFPLRKKRQYEFYIIDDDESKCLNEAASLCDHLLKQKNFIKENVIVRVLVRNEKQELLRGLDKRYGNSIYLRYVNEDNSASISILRKDKGLLTSVRHNEILLFGSTGLADELLKNLLCLLNLPESNYRISIFDADARMMASRLKMMAPEVLNLPLDNYLRPEKDERANYDLHYYEVDYDDENFLDLLEEIRKPNVIYMAYEDDRRNYEGALFLKRYYASKSDDMRFPHISASIKDINLNKILPEEDGVTFFGNYENAYNYSRLITPELEQAARKVHLAYCSNGNENVYRLDENQQNELLDQSSFYSYVNQRSSFQAALSMEYYYDYICRLNDVHEHDNVFVNNYLSLPENMNKIAMTEHDRWNTYQRLCGYRKPNIIQMQNIARLSKGSRVKDDNLLLHPALVDYDELKTIEQVADRILSEYEPQKKTNYIDLDKIILRQMLKILNIE